MKKLFILFFFLPLLLHGQSTIHITATHDTICYNGSVTFSALVTGTTVPHYQWALNGRDTGIDSPGFTLDTLGYRDTVSCKLTNAAGDTTFAISNDLHIIMQFPAYIFPPATWPFAVCVGSSITLTAFQPGGTWDARFGFASVSSGGSVTGIEGGEEGFSNEETIVYTLTNACGVTADSVAVNVDLPPDANYLLGNGYDNLMCVGQHLLINDGDGVAGYIFSVNGHVACGSAEVVGISPGVDIIINILTNGCGSDTSKKTVQVLTTPITLPPILSTTSLCLGDSLQVFDSSIGYFHWYTKNDAIVRPYENSLAPTIIPRKAGIDTITLAVWNKCGSATTSAVFNVLPPGPISGPSHLCTEKTGIFVDDYAGGIWSSDNPSIVSIDANGTVSPLAPGNTRITYTMGGCYAYKNLVITMQPEAITGSDILCITATSKLNETLNIGRWSSDNPDIVSIDSTGLAAGLMPGVVTIRYTTPDGCFAEKNTSVYPMPAPPVGAGEVCKGSTISLSDATPGGNWSSTSDLISLDNGSVKGISEGIATVTYTSEHGCPMIKRIAVEDCESDLIIFPNPTHDELIIHCLTTEYSSYRIVNIVGETVTRNELQGMYTIADVSHLLKGVYFICIEGSDKKRTLKFVRN